MILRKHSLAALAVFIVSGLAGSASAQLVPGTGTLVLEDDFEDASWHYEHRNPKSSEEQDKNERRPGGYSINAKWAESALRGHPDVIKRIKTPDGGLPGSKASLLMRSLNTGVPGHRSYSQQQDDLLMSVSSNIGGHMPVSWSPSVTCRVYIPDFEYFENRSGAHFGFRADLIGSKWDPDAEEEISIFGRKRKIKVGGGGGIKRENYWPGFFICYTRKEESRTGKPFAYILVRSGNRGQEIQGPVIETPGWWTLGMSFTPDGRVHFYGHAGTEDLTARDLITSQKPYDYTAETFYTIFFNVVNNDDGRNWTTPWVIDDPKVYWMRNGSQAASTSKLPARK